VPLFNCDGCHFTATLKKGRVTLFQGAALDIREERRIRNNRILLYVVAVGITSYGLLLFLGLM
jgi:hypothetical protein